MARHSTRSNAVSRFSVRPGFVAAVVLMIAGMGLAACSSNGTAATSTSGVIRAVGAENEYANVLEQIGGKYVAVSSILNNPNTDPHTFEASTSVAQEVSQAGIGCAERRWL